MAEGPFMYLLQGMVVETTTRVRIMDMLTIFTQLLFLESMRTVAFLDTPRCVPV